MGTIQLLVVEDNKNDIELLTYALKKAGINFDLRQVQTEEELVEALQTQRPDLVLSDNSLPRLDGERALEIVKAQNSDIPFVVFSGASQERFEEMKAKGAAECVSKVDLNLLPGVILKTINNMSVPKS